MSSDFHGLPTRSLENQFIRIEYLAEAGPRLVRLHVVGSNQNQLVEVPDIALPTPIGDFYLRGGHRLWHGLEGMPRSYVPDNNEVEVETVHGGVRLTLAADQFTGIRKSIKVLLHALESS